MVEPIQISMPILPVPVRPDTPEQIVEHVHLIITGMGQRVCNVPQIRQVQD